MSLPRWIAAFGLGVVLSSACYHPQTHELPPVRTPGPRSVAAAGTTFTITLIDPLDSSIPEAPFNAVTVDSIVAADRTTIVWPGAAVLGRATGAPGPSGGILRLELASIETIQGRTSVFAALAPAQSNAVLNTLVIEGPGPNYDVLLRHAPPPRPESRPPAAIGGGPREETANVQAIRLPAGTYLHLVLTRPLSAAHIYKVGE